MSIAFGLRNDPQRLALAKPIGAESNHTGHSKGLLRAFSLTLNCFEASKIERLAWVGCIRARPPARDVPQYALGAAPNIWPPRTHEPEPHDGSVAVPQSACYKEGTSANG